jgi:hypothetical protein
MSFWSKEVIPYAGFLEGSQLLHHWRTPRYKCSKAQISWQDTTSSLVISRIQSVT